MQITKLKAAGSTVATVFPQAVAAVSIVDATSHLKGRSTRSIREIAGAMLGIAQGELQKASSETEAVRIDMDSKNGAAVAAGFDTALVCLDGVAFPVSVRDIHQSNSRFSDGKVQAQENRRADILAEMERVTAQPQSLKRDEQLRILDEIHSRA